MSFAFPHTRQALDLSARIVVMPCPERRDGRREGLSSQNKSESDFEIPLIALDRATEQGFGFRRQLSECGQKSPADEPGCPVSYARPRSCGDAPASPRRLVHHARKSGIPPSHP